MPGNQEKGVLDRDEQGKGSAGMAELSPGKCWASEAFGVFGGRKPMGPEGLAGAMSDLHQTLLWLQSWVTRDGPG